MERTLASLRAMAEPTRLRLLSLCAQTELTVSELVTIVGQSQPSVSRHLKLLCDSGLLERMPEGSHAFYRVRRSFLEPLLHACLDSLAADDPLLSADHRRLGAIKEAREARAAAYFSENAVRWAELRSLHIDESEVESALLKAFAGRKIRKLLDIGSGPGRVLEILGPMAEQACGVDLSRDMLAVARARLEKAGLAHCSVRQADMYALPWPDKSFDAVALHQVLHFAERPGAAIREAGRVLEPGGCLAIVDFAPHRLEELRTEHNHRRLGFSFAEMEGWCKDAGLVISSSSSLAGHPLTVNLWLASAGRT